MPTKRQKRYRTSSWKPPEDGDAATILVPHLEHAVLEMCKNNLYPSKDFKKGIHVPFLVWCAPSLEALATLDPRGGYFRQEHVRGAVVKIAARPEWNLKVQKLARCMVKTFDDTITLLAYAVRVMLAHCREKFAAWLNAVAKSGREAAEEPCPSNPEELIKIYKIFVTHTGDAVPAAAAAKKKQRFPNPFAAFRDDSKALDDASEESDEEIAISSSDNEMVDIAAIGTNVYKVLASGAKVPADSLEKGVAGFIIANFGDESLPTKVPNRHLMADGTIPSPMPPLPPPPLPKAQAKAQAKALAVAAAAAAADPKAKAKQTAKPKATAGAFHDATLHSPPEWTIPDSSPEYEDLIAIKDDEGDAPPVASGPIDLLDEDEPPAGPAEHKGGDLTPVLIITPGHSGISTLVLKTSWSDKMQILSVQPKEAPNPESITEKVKKDLDEYVGTLRGKVKELAPEVAVDLRSRAATRKIAHLR